jgi:Sir2 family
MKAKRIVVICGPLLFSILFMTCLFSATGAGISVQAGIPDFRSSDGLFKSIKRDNPRETMSSGKELFDASVFNVSKVGLYEYKIKNKVIYFSLGRAYYIAVLSDDCSIIRLVSGCTTHFFSPSTPRAG